MLAPRIVIELTERSLSPVFFTAVAPHPMPPPGPPAPEEYVAFTHVFRPCTCTACCCPPDWKRLVLYTTTPVPKTIDATKIIMVVSTALIAFLLFVLIGNILPRSVVLGYLI